jgi:hypothetical protein
MDSFFRAGMPLFRARTPIFRARVRARAPARFSLRDLAQGKRLKKVYMYFSLIYVLRPERPTLYSPGLAAWASAAISR